MKRLMALILVMKVEAASAQELVQYVYPLAKQTVTSGFGTRRHPIANGWREHRGVDLRTKQGEPVRAIKDGLILKAGRAGGYGLRVTIYHGNGLVTVYAHLNKIEVAKGAYVRAGELIGAAGSTGAVTGPHLHFEVMQDGEHIDPEKYLYELTGKALG